MKALKYIAILALGAIIAVVVVIGGPKVLPSLAFFSSDTEDTDSQIVNSVTREQQVVLLSLGIQGLSEKDSDSKIFGVSVPGSDRTTFLQYSFTAKLGIEGQDVTIEPTGDNSYLVTIPEFTFIGVDEPTYKLAAEDNGVLSWVTPDIDTTYMINDILNDSTKQQYIEANKDTLEDQAKVFYTNIIMGVDPTVTVEFAYS